MQMGSLTANNILNCSAYITITFFPGHVITARHVKMPPCYMYSTDCGNKCGHVLQDVVNTAGFYTEERGRGAGIPPSPSLTQKSLNWVWLLFSQVLNNNLVPDCVTSNLRGSKFQIFWGGIPPDTLSRHAHLCVCECTFTRYYHPATILFLPPLNSKSCMEPWTHSSVE